MIDDEKILVLFFERSEQGIRELDIKYDKRCHKLSYVISSLPPFPGLRLHLLYGSRKL